MKIEACGLTKKFDGTSVLSDVTLSIDIPGIYALVGPNGSGKTTLLRILALLEKPDSGSLEINGEAAGIVCRRAATTWQRKMVLVHSPAVMLSGSVRYNAEYGLRVRGQPRAGRRARVAALMEKLGLSGLEQREAGLLSAGEAQRLALVRALAWEPEIIFLDEPTANLDPLSAKLIEQAIVALERAGRTVVLASHNLWQVERLARWIWFLNQGRIELAGPAEQVLHQGDRSFWSKFLGRDNVFSGSVACREGRKVFSAPGASFEVVTGLEGRAAASLNPAEIILSLEPLASSARNVLPGTIQEVISEGGLYKVMMDAGLPLVAVITKASWEEMGLKKGKKVYAIFKASAVRVWREEP